MVTRVIGFLFDESGEHTLLVLRKAPAWKKGLLDGIGRAISSQGKSNYLEMVDAGIDEVGITPSYGNWEQFLRLSFADYEYVCFAAVVSFKNMATSKTGTADTEMVKVDEVRASRMLPMASWLLPMAHFHMFRAHFDRIGFLQVQGSERITLPVFNRSSKAAIAG